MVNTLAIALVALAATVPAVSAHSQMTLPNPKLSDVSKTNSPLGTVDGVKVLPPPAGQSYSQGTDTNIKAYVQAFKAQTKYTSLKDLIMDNYVEDGNILDHACGLTDKTYTQPLPADVEWSAGQHPGPREVWCDDVLAFSDNDCAVNYPGIKLPYNKSKCVGKKVLWSMFLGMHVPMWQVYMGCTAIEGSASTGSTSSSTTLAVTTKAPSPASTPAAVSGDEYGDEYATPSLTQRPPRRLHRPRQWRLPRPQRPTAIASTRRQRLRPPRRSATVVCATKIVPARLASALYSFCALLLRKRQRVFESLRCHALVSKMLEIETHTKTQSVVRSRDMR